MTNPKPQQPRQVDLASALARPTISFTAHPSSIELGQSATLSWQTTNATKVAVKSVRGYGLGVNDSLRVKPTDSVTYRLTAYGPGGRREATTHVTVTLPPAPESSWLAHERARHRLEKLGAKVIATGARGYPDILFELGGCVFAVEVKGSGDRLRSQQKRVIDALSRLEHIYVLREGGKKAEATEVTFDEMLANIRERLR
jgi:hypothetical protein